MPTTAATRWNVRLLSWPYWTFATAAVIFSLLKVGITLRPLQPDSLDSFPTPQPTWSTLSYGMRTIAWIGRWDSQNAYSVISIFISILAVLVIVLCSKKFLNNEDSRIAILLLITSPLAVVLYNNQGRHDALMILGSVLLGFLGRNVWTAVVAALIMIGANPEQAVLATLILFACTFTETFRSWRKGAIVAFATSTTAFVILSFWAQASGIGSRASYIKSLFGNSIYGFVSNFSLSLYAGFGILWILVAYFVVQQDRKRKLLLFVFLIGLPLVFTMITLDQTRVFVGVTAAITTALAIQIAPEIAADLRRIGITNVLFWTLIAVTLLPSFEISVDHVVRPPFAWTFEVVLPQIQQAIGIS